jgi:putative membrane protein
MKHYLLLITVLAAAISAQAANQSNSNTSAVPVAGSTDLSVASKVLADIYRTNLHEIEMGKLAQDRGSKGIKEYGDNLVKDHEKSQKKVQELADQLGIKLIDNDEAMANKEHAEMTKLKDLKDAAFDKAFAAAMVEGHTKAIARLETAQKEAAGPIAGLINETLPVLKIHLSKAQNLRK